MTEIVYYMKEMYGNDVYLCLHRNYQYCIYYKWNDFRVYILYKQHPKHLLYKDITT